ncbi:hypothetical protein JMN32_09610 [Fulvivirga sp. 29W222]|uniref:Fibronectin type 3 domain-containing protein n=1 Tax=Fulvivirga marina TaxID=2494733 RepID=A0A937KB87_9BACT|nr:hypothetical protein [Fulvivirga marina]MBL6446566.1 hypothetical protein [Fulvivirga marina]
MNFFVKILSIILLTLTASSLFAQTGRVLVQNAPNTSLESPVINVKWYTEQLWYPEGVNVYRRQSSEDEWTKLNSTPVLKKSTVSMEALQEDEDLEVMVEIMNDNPEQAEGFLLINLFIKSFQSMEFSRFLGIQYDDASINWGDTYQYQVRIINNGEESVLATSPEITAGEYMAEAPVQSFKASLEDYTANFSWLAEEGRFYGVNVYRTSSIDGKEIKLNGRPIVLSENEDANAPQSGIMYRDDSLRQGVIYKYQIAGTDFFGGETQRSETVEVQVEDVTPPKAPVNLLRKVDTLNIQVSWDIVPEEDLAGFNVYRSVLSDGPYDLVNSNLLAHSDTVFFDQVAYPGNYYYTVASVDYAGNEGVSSPVYVEVQDVIPPASPEGVTIKSDTGKFVLSWAANEEPDLRGYLIFRTVNENDSKNYVLLNSQPLKGNVFTQTLPKNAKNTFLYKIVAVDTSYNRSEPSKVVRARMPDVTAPVKPFIKQVLVSGDSIEILWLKNPEPDVKGYVLQSSKERDLWNAVAEIPASENIYKIKASTGGNFSYRLQAVDSSGNASEFSNVMKAEIAIKQVSGKFKEVKLKYNKRKKQLDIIWEYEGKECKGFIIYKGEAENTLRPVTGLLKDMQYRDKDLSEGHTYKYEVRCYQNDGEVIKSGIIAELIE